MKIPKLLVGCLLLILSSCSSRIVSLKGSYPVKGYSFSSSKSTAQLINEVKAYLENNDMIVKLADTASGNILINTKQIKLTREGSAGHLMDSSSFIVVEKVYEPGSNKYYYAKEANSEWSIKITDQNNVRNIEIRLVGVTNMSFMYMEENLVSAANKRYRSKAYSTGVLEKLIEQNIK